MILRKLLLGGAVMSVAFAIDGAALAANSFEGLGDLTGGATESFASGISNDGSIVVGRSDSTSGRESFRWEAGTMTGLGDLGGALGLGLVGLFGLLAQRRRMAGIAMTLGAVTTFPLAAQATMLDATAIAGKTITLDTNVVTLSASFTFGSLTIDENGVLYATTGGASSTTNDIDIIRPGQALARATISDIGTVQGYDLLYHDGFIYVANTSGSLGRLDRDDLLALAPAGSTVNGNSAEDTGFSSSPSFDSGTYAMRAIPDAFSTTDGGKLLIADKATPSTAFVFDPDTNTRSAVRTVPTTGDLFTSFDFSPDGTRLFELSASGNTAVTELDNQYQTVASYAIPGAASGELAAMEVNPSTGEIFVLIADTYEMVVIASDLSQSLVLATDIVASTWPQGMAFSDDGNTLYFLDPGEQRVQSISGLTDRFFAVEPEIPTPAAGVLLLAGLGGLLQRRR